MALAVRRGARQSADPADWTTVADQARVEVAPRLARLRQLTMRDDASLFRTHPPSGLRARMLESRTRQSALVVLSATDARRIDEELAASYRTVRHNLTAG